MRDKCAKTTQFDPIAACERGNDLIEDRIHDILDIPLVEVRVVLGNALNEFGFDHKVVGPGKVGIHFRENTLNCQDAK